MNQLGQLPVAPRTKAVTPSIAVTAPSTESEAQARQLDASLLAFAREVMTHDDAASEMPLRQVIT